MKGIRQGKSTILLEIYARQYAFLAPIQHSNFGHMLRFSNTNIWLKSHKINKNEPQAIMLII